MPRLAGIDLARAIAIGGMFVAHLAKEDGEGWWWLADGRSSALFALLAGCGLGFMTARAYPDRERARQEYPRILRRALWLGVTGVLLMFLQTPVVVILSSYAVMFALTVPFLNLRPAALFGCAAAVVLVAPPIVQGVRLLVNGAPEPGMWIPGVFELASGYYPALSWLAYSLTGLGLVRLRLYRYHVQALLLLCGAALCVAGYGGGARLEEAMGGRGTELTYPMSLVSVEPHTDSGFEILGNIGASLVVIALSLLLTRRLLQQLFWYPATAAGSMSLTLYVAHLFYIAILGPDAVWHPTSQGPLVWLIVGSLVFATAWKLTLGKGPLERGLARLSATTALPRARTPE